MDRCPTDSSVGARLEFPNRAPIAEAMGHPFKLALRSLPIPHCLTTFPHRVSVVTPSSDFKSNPSTRNTNIPPNTKVIAPETYKNPPPNPLSRSSPLVNRFQAGSEARYSTPTVRRPSN